MGSAALLVVLPFFKDMKATATLFIWLLTAVLYIAAANPGKQPAARVDASPKTVVYLVRHAEKVTSEPQDKDPLLTAEGYQRAEDLKKYLSKKQVDALYATDYQRTRLTLAPLATARGLTVNLYSSRDHQALVDQVLKEHRGQTVVIAAHSNTLLPLIEAFKAETQIKEIGDEEYSYIFKLTIDQNNKAKLEVGRYGRTSAQAGR